MFLSKLFKSKASKVITMLGAFAMTMGAGVIVVTSGFVEPDEIVETKAESWVNNPTVYYVPSDNWAKDGAVFKLNYFNGGSFVGAVNMTLEGTGAAKGLFDGRKVFKGVVSANSISRVQILRFNSDYSKQWNYSGNIYLSDNNASPVLMMDADQSFGDNWTTSTSGVWWNANNDFSVYKTSDQSPSLSTGRVFFYNSGTHWADNTTYKGCAVYAWGGSASPKKWTTGDATYSATVYHLSWFTDDNGTSYGYADIPINATGYKFVRTTVDNEYTTSLGYFSDTSLIIDSFAYVRKGRASGNGIDSDGAINNVAGANLMKKIIQAYNTCNSSVLNGYGAFSALNTNFYSRATDDAKSATEQSLSGNTVSIQTHFEGMAARSGGGSPAGVIPGAPTGQESPLTTTLWIVLASGIAGLAAIGSAYFISKKKKKNRA